ncbi:hypothetical protein BDV95DRAFT_573488 [Massariosphaeria phaeospora]|uniref:Uncharacterized protein n=1 Tax=Massariosphaeria phaeospora TaxID=100035 RepID=A0A7C8I7E6_9PLEO|nr:hypothetical protein BDV95DRAFT_573488 [Massariosphaeria phaeospora]
MVTQNATSIQDDDFLAEYIASDDRTVLATVTPEPVGESFVQTRSTRGSPDKTNTATTGASTQPDIYNQLSFDSVAKDPFFHSVRKRLRVSVTPIDEDVEQNILHDVSRYITNYRARYVVALDSVRAKEMEITEQVARIRSEKAKTAAESARLRKCLLELGRDEDEVDDA